MRMSETGKVEKEDGSTVWISDDGREYKSKSGMWKRNKKLKSESTPNESDTEAKKEEEVKKNPEAILQEWEEAKVQGHYLVQHLSRLEKHHH